MKSTRMILGNRVLALVLTLAMLLPMAMPVMAAASIPTQTQTVTKGGTTVSRTALWDFAAASQLADFSLYQSATSKLVHSDGKLIADGADGEMKALITNSLSNVRSVSVDIIPGSSGLVNAGLYVGAKNADSGVNAIEAMTFMVQSNFSGWSDAPNRIDIIQGQFNNSWKELSRTISEAGNGNALFSGGNKQPLNLKLTFGDGLLLLTLSLVSNPNKYLQLMYQVDSAAMEGQLGLRANACDVHFDNLKVEYEQELPENSLLWDFADASQAEDFTFYTNGNNSFAVTDGMLKSNGGHGEMKAIFNEDMANISAMSVDIIPGASGLMNAGVYVGAKNVSADQDKADAIAVMIESMFSGWDDAPNRVDLWLGKFTQGWGGEVGGSRLVSETGNNNALYAGGVKKPLNLKLEFGENTMTATLSLVENPNRYVQKTWTMEAAQLQGQIGLRNQFIDLCYDNLIITYKTPIEQPADEEETVYVNDGYSFCQSSLRPWKLTKELTAAPYTLEAWVNAPQGVHDNAVGYIVGNASRAPSVSMQMIAGGKLRLSYKTENADLTVTTKNFDVDTDIRTGKWTHVAYTVDVASDTVIAYINGKAVATWNEAGLTAITIPDKILPSNTFAIGSLESSDDAKNKFVGLIADVRLWDSALSAAQIAESMMTQYTEPVEGLLFNAPLAELAEGVFADLSGNGNTVAPYDSMLNLQTETHEPGAYSMVVIPDQQILNNYDPAKLMAMYQWIADNREKENIQIVMNVGDMADNCGNITQWENNRAAVELLPDDLPFIAAPGNHDYDTNSGWDQGYGVREQLTLMNQYLPRSLFEAYPTEIGFFDEVNSANQWQSFTVNGNNYLVMALEYVPQDDVIAWANDVVSSHPNHQVIVVTHSYVGSYGNLDVPKLWNAFISRHENIIMAFSGHVWHTNVVRRTDKGVNGNDVHQMLMDAQVSDTGSEGNKYAAMIGLLRFNADGTQCDVSYYSTNYGQYDAGSNFTLTLPKQEQTFVATAGGKSYTSVSQALESGETVRLLDDCSEKVTVKKDAIIDLAGFDMTDVTVAEGMQLTLIDTATDDYTGDYGCATVNGAVMSFAQVDGKNYVMALENGVYSAHAYDVEVTHVSLKPAQDALGYKAKVLGDEMVLKYATAVGFNMWVENNPVKTCTTSAKREFTLRLKNILAVDGGLMEIHATAFVSFDGRTLPSQQHTTTMQQTLQTINGAWSDYSASQKAAVKDLCDRYYDTVSQWGLDNIYPVAEDGAVNPNYEALTGSVTVNNISGFVANGKLIAPNNGEGKVILENTPAGNKTISVELYPNGSINSGIYLGASNAAAPQDSVNAIAVIIESSFSDNPNRADIVIGNFPAWKQYHRYVIEGANALFTNGVKEPVKLTVQQNGNELTVTLALISDPSKSATTTYTYDGEYDLVNGQVGLRSQFNNCAFDNFQINDVVYTFENEASTDGLSFYHSAHTNGIQATAANSLLLHGSATFTGGTYAATMNTAGKNAAGIVFGADDSGKNYHLFRIGANQFVDLVKVENGVETILDRGYLSAGHINTNDNRLEIVKDGDTVYCYYYNRFDKINCYAVNDVELAGDRIGLWAAASGTIFRDVTITNATEKRTAETLIFGHSYTEMWWDFETYFPEYADIDDIGIGGSVAAHWEALTDEIISYEPKLGIYNIGINDLTGGTPPKAIIESMEKALLEIKAALPQFEVVLVSVSHCPARPAITDTISQTNALMRNLAASYDWMYYAEAEYLFCTDPNDPLSTNADLFIDGLHPSAVGYQMMADVIKAAIRGENQPEYDEDLAAAQLAEVKANKLASMDIYSETAYTAENWVNAKPHYDAAVAKIQACTTEDALNALDLSAEIAALNAIPNKSVQIVENILNADTRDALAADAWTKTDDNTANISGYSYALDNTALYSDAEIIFKVSNNTGDIATGGIFLRATQLSNNGIYGYLINYVSASDLMQVYYVNNVYNTDGSTYTLKYIGGVNFGAYGNVLNTEFYAKIEGDQLILSTVERHQAGLAPLTVVDLTYGGQFELIESGHIGMLAWNNGISYDLQLKNFKGEPVEQKEEVESDAAAVFVANLLNSSTSLNADSWTKVDDHTVQVNGFGYALDNSVYSDANLTFKASNNTGNIATGGVLLRCTQRANNGLDGYLINYVSASNYIQVYYLSNVYNTDGTEYVLTYLGGIVFNGNVVNTEFYASIQGSTLYINTLDRMDNGEANLATVDLTYGGKYAVYESGKFGLLSWNEGVSFNMTIQEFAV